MLIVNCSSCDSPCVTHLTFTFEHKMFKRRDFIIPFIQTINIKQIIQDYWLVTDKGII